MKPERRRGGELARARRGLVPDKLRTYDRGRRASVGSSVFARKAERRVDDRRTCLRDGSLALYSRNDARRASAPAGVFACSPSVAVVICGINAPTLLEARTPESPTDTGPDGATTPSWVA